MERQRKERLVGAAVLVMLAVIFIPMVLDNSVQPESGISGTNIPPKPEGEFESRVIPLNPPRSQVPGSQAEPVAPQPAPAEPRPAATAPAAETAPVAPADSAPARTPAPAAKAPEQETPTKASSTKPAPAGGKNAAAPVGVTAWVVQLGSFSSEQNAEVLNRKLRQAGYSSFVEPLQQGGGGVFRVRVGPELRRTGAQAVRDRLQAEMGLDGIVVPYP